MMIIENDFNIGDEVYLKTDVDQHVRLVTSFNVRTERITYELSCGTNTSWHEPFEISAERDVLKATGTE